MRRNLTAAIALTLLAGAAVAATSVFGEDSRADPRPAYATVEVRLRAGGEARGRVAGAKPVAKPEVVYLKGKGTVNTAPPPTGVGPYIDFKLTAPRNQCRRLIGAGIKAANLDLFEQGSYAGGHSYHVLMGLDDGAAATPTTISYQSHVICLNGVR